MNDARIACTEFGSGWNVAKVSVGALVCTNAGYQAGDNCYNLCHNWRLLVWEDGADDIGKWMSEGKSYSTKAGKYYGGHTPCNEEDNFPTCGQWTDTIGNNTQGFYRFVNKYNIKI